jgi:signal transduction histidine kinase
VANWVRDAGTGRAERSARTALVAVVPPLLAFAIEAQLLPFVTRWLLFTGAVIVSSWAGGLAAGLASTVLSVALVWWYLVPPVRDLGAADPKYYATVVIFLAIGTAVSVLHENLRRVRQALASTANELEEAQRLAHIGSWAWDFRTSTAWWSPELYRIHRRDPSLPLPGPAELSSFFTAESGASLREAAERLRRDGTPFELELESIAPDGARTWVSTHGEGVLDRSGRLVGLRGTSQDITRVKNLERMKEEWTSVIAHDLRQPIGVITMSAEMLPELHAGEISKSESATVNHIRSAARSLARMVDDLIDVSRLEAHRLSLERSWFDPERLVRETLEHLKHLTGRSRIDVSASTATPVFVDEGRFEQILGNLVSNAVKYGERDGDIQVRLTRRDDHVLFSVANRGRGIPQHELSALFTRFGRSSTSHGAGVPGLGLGLYIARGLVEAHGGRMWAESVPGDTTTFHFSLPCRREDAAAA